MALGSTCATGRMFQDARHQLHDFTDKSLDYARENPWIVTGLGVGALLGGYFLSSSKGSYRKRPDTSSLTGGGIERDRVKSAYSDYHDSYGTEAGSGITDRSRTTGDPSVYT